MNQNGILTRKTFQGWYDVNLEQKLDFITPGLRVSGKVSYSSGSTTRGNIRNGGRLGNNNDAAYKTLVRYQRIYDYANPVYNADGTITYPLLSENRLPDQEAIGMPPSVEYDNIDGYTRRLYYEFAINYGRNFNDHNVSALALVNRQIQDNRHSDNYIRFANYREDWVGRVTYNWKERYLTEFNISYTGSEKFERGNRFGLFPSVSAGWRISEESFIKRRKIGQVLNNLKIRYSYGKTGYDGAWTDNRWSYIQTYSSGGNVIFGNTTSTEFGPTYSEGTMANIYSTWEESIKQNFGIEIGLWNKLNITLDLFDERRKGILMEPQTIADWVSIGQSRSNLGRTKNHGFEIETAWRDRIGADFNYWANFSVSASENRVVYRDDPAGYADYMKEAGKPIGHQLRYLAVGNFEMIDDIFNAAQSNSINGWTSDRLVPGDLIYIDFNNDGILNGQDKVAVKELNYPLTTYSFSFGFDWKGIGFSALLYAPTGVYRLVDSRYFWSFTRSQIMAQPHVGDRWDPDNPNRSGVVMPSLHLADQDSSYNGTESTLRYKNYSYLRLKNVELSYKFPKKVTEKINMSNLQVYVKGTNLLTFWNGDKRLDPETENAGKYPIVRTYTAGVRFAF